ITASNASRRVSSTSGRRRSWLTRCQSRVPCGYGFILFGSGSTRPAIFRFSGDTGIAVWLREQGTTPRLAAHRTVNRLGFGTFSVLADRGTVTKEGLTAPLGADILGHLPQEFCH